MCLLKPLYNFPFFLLIQRKLFLVNIKTEREKHLYFSKLPKDEWIVKNNNTYIVTKIVFPLACVELPTPFDIRVLNACPSFNQNARAQTLLNLGFAY